MKRSKFVFGTIALVVVAAVGAWSQHAGHGGMDMPAAQPMSKAEVAKARVEKLNRLQEKIDGIEEKLEDPKLSEKKREKLKKKLDALYAKKDELLGVPADPRQAMKSSCASESEACKDGAEEVYVCPMGDYTGPKTKDGKCPKCGMALQRKAAGG